MIPFALGGIIHCSASAPSPPTEGPMGNGGVYHFVLRGVTPPASWNKLKPICAAGKEMRQDTLKALKVANVA